MINIVKNIDSQSNMSLYVDEGLSQREHITYDFIFLIEGEMELKFTDRTFEMYNGDVVIVDKNQIYELEKKSDKNLLFVMEMSENLLMKSMKIGGLSFNCCSMDSLDKNYDTVRDLVHKVIELIILKERSASFLLYGSIYQLLNEIISSYAVYTRPISQQDVRVIEMIEYIYDHYYEDLNLKTVSSVFYMEPIYFSKFFKKKVGVNFKAYVDNMRLNFAGRELRETQKSIIRIAVDNGFSNINSFIKLFKAAHGVTPSQFREQGAVHEQTLQTPQPMRASVAKKRYQAYKNKAEIALDYSEPVTVADVTAKVGEASPIWSLFINVSQAQELLSDGMKKHILLLKKEIGYRYVRIWNILTEQLYANWENSIIINFEKIDDIFDFLIDNQIYPWIDLNKYYPAETGNQPIDEELCRWQRLFSSFLEHVVNRYGKKNIKKWHFELTLNKQTDPSDVEKYCRFFMAAKQIIKNISPDISLGGGGFKISTNSRHLMDLLKQFEGLDSDFYSFKMFPYSYYQNQTREERNSQRITDENYLLNRIVFVEQLLKEFPKKKIYITEWNNTVSNKNVINDSLYKGAYIVKNLIDSIGKVDGIGYWIASDLHHSGPRTNEILNGGSGLLNKFGMYKPAMFAMKFFTEIEGLDIIKQDKNLIICRIESDELIMLGHNYQHPNQLYFLKNEDKILPGDLDSMFKPETRQFRIRLEHLTPGKYEIRTYVCNKQNGSLFDRWKELGFSNNLRPSDIAYLKEKNTIQMQLEKVCINLDYLDLEKIIESNEFFAIHIRKETKIVN